MDDGRVNEETEDYHAAVERHFVALRGSPLFVSPREWQLIHRWREAQIPLRVVKQGLDQAFANSKSRRPIRRLSYCRQTVEASYRRFREAVAGVGKAGRETEKQTTDEGSDIRDYLERLAKELAVVRENVDDTRFPMCEAIDRTVRRLSALNEETREPIRLDDLERELETLEGALIEAAEAALEPKERETCRDAAERSLRDYQARMPADVFESALRRAYLKRVRSRFDLPALSLFYL